MKDTLSNKLISFKATLAVADQPESLPIWEDQVPLGFTKSLGTTRAAVTTLAGDGAAQSTTAEGSTAALRDLRQSFEIQLHILTRATFRFLKTAGRTEDAAKLDLTPSDLHNSRAVALAGLGETVLDLAEPLTQPTAPGQPAPGAELGITAALFATVDALWERYSTAVGAPIGARAKRKALTAGLPAKFAAVEEQFAELDDLVIQFGSTPAGKEFVEAWFNARRVAQLGRRSAKPKTPPSPGPTA